MAITHIIYSWQNLLDLASGSVPNCSHKAPALGQRSCARGSGRCSRASLRTVWGGTGPPPSRQRGQGSSCGLGPLLLPAQSFATRTGLNISAFQYSWSLSERSQPRLIGRSREETSCRKCPAIFKPCCLWEIWKPLQGTTVLLSFYTQPMGSAASRGHAPGCPARPRLSPSRTALGSSEGSGRTGVPAAGSAALPPTSPPASTSGPLPK